MFWSSQPSYVSAQSVLGEGSVEETTLNWYAIEGKHFAAFKRQFPNATLAGILTALVALKLPQFGKEVAQHYAEMQGKHLDRLILAAIDA